MNIPPNLGPYRIQVELGRGGMAIVYRAVDNRTGQIVALKVLLSYLAHDERYLRRFEQEGRSVARLQHNNIVKVLDVGAAQGYHYLAMEYIDGQTLTEFLRGQRTLLPLEKTVAIIHQIGDALDYAHELGILHRDIKNSNILIDRGGRALLTDFGVAKLMDQAMTAYTVVGTTVGTPAFMSPEQASGGELDRRADVYSLGVVAYSMLTGAMPFRSDSPLALLHKIVYEPPILPEELNPNLPPGMLYALKKVLSKSPAARHQSAGAFADALDKGITWRPSSGEMAAVQEKMLLSTSEQASVVAASRTPAPRRSGVLLGVLLGISAVVLAAFLLLNLPGLFPSSGNNATPTSTASAPLTIALRPIQPAGADFSLEAPIAWLPSSATYGAGVLQSFDDPDRTVRLFAAQVDRPEGAPDDVASQGSITAFFQSADHPYTDIQPAAEQTLQQVGDHQFVEQRAQAAWQGRPVQLHIFATTQGARVYLVGLAAGDQETERFAAVLEAAIKGLQVGLPLVTESTATATPAAVAAADLTTPPTSTPLAITETKPAEFIPAVVITATLTAPASDTPASTLTPTLAPSDTPRATPIPTETNTSLPTTSPSATNTPLPTATPTPSPSETPRPTPTPTKTPLPTATPTPSPSDTPHPTPTPTSTATPLPTATPTDTPTAPPTATWTPTPDMQATNTSIAETVAAIVRLTIAAQPTHTSAHTPTATKPAPTSTPLPAQTPTQTPTRTPTVMPTPTATKSTPTSTPVSKKAPTQTPTATTAPISTPSVKQQKPPRAKPTPSTATSTSTRTATPTPTWTTVPTPTPTATSTQTAKPTVTPTKEQPTRPPPTVAPPASAGPYVAVIQSPADNYSSADPTEFRWTADAPLAAGQLFEVVFWNPQKPEEGAQGWVGAAAESAVRINLSNRAPGSYQWALYLVVIQPKYERLRLLAGPYSLVIPGASEEDSGDNPPGGSEK